jgi:hypothetical protein
MNYSSRTRKGPAVLFFEIVIPSEVEESLIYMHKVAVTLVAVLAAAGQASASEIREFDLRTIEQTLARDRRRATFD